ncbi:unnamed protein product [Timema podura]|uniref:Uncharacterized protein n=1 Tax=Timema podura TaxID=61482 RepID=A0ABN7PG98_TIMPD|nr:unnamed protein product [Timema podura]
MASRVLLAAIMILCIGITTISAQHARCIELDTKCNPKPSHLDPKCCEGAACEKIIEKEDYFCTSYFV